MHYDKMMPRSTTGLTCKSMQTHVNYKFCISIYTETNCIIPEVYAGGALTLRVCTVIFCNGATVSLNGSLQMEL